MKPTDDATRASAEAMPANSGQVADALRLAMGSLGQAENYIHATWMAARSLGGDQLAAGEALQAVIHMAGDAIEDARSALRKAGAQ